MKDFFKNKIVTALVVTATIILAGVAVFTAVRLYQQRQQPVAPTAPESEPKATQEPKACALLTFTLTEQSPTPTEPGPSSTPTNTPTNTPTSTPTNTPVPSGTPSPTPTPTEPGRGGEPSPTPTPTNTSAPNPTATPTSSSNPTSTPTTSEVVAASPTPGGANLPAAGVPAPTIILGLFAILIITASLVIAL